MNMMVITQCHNADGPFYASVRVESTPEPANSATMADPHRESLSFDELTADERAELLGLLDDALA